MRNWLELSRPWIFLAPMAGVADWPFREVCYRYGAEIAVSHLVAAYGLVANPRRLLPTVGANHDARPYIAQLFGREPEDFRRAARILTDALPLVGIDINMGCPANTVVSSLHGSALLREPERAAEIVAATCAGTHLPVSVKLRTGWDSVVSPDVARLLEAAGAKALVVHGRTREQKYSGPVDLDAVEATRRAVSIPVVGNGNVVSVATAREMLERTGVDGVMVGRGAVGNPWLFADLQVELKGEDRFSRIGTSKAELIRHHARLAFADQGDRAALTIRKHLMGYTRGHPFSTRLRRMVEHLRSARDVEEWIREFEDTTDESPPAIGESVA